MTGHEFQRCSRILKPSEFSLVFEGTELRGSTSQLLMLARNNEKNTPRIGFVLAKKHIRLAVDRNRIKRLVRESFRLNKADLDCLDIVILARTGAADLSNEELRTMVDKLWFRLKRPSHGKSSRTRNRTRR